MSTWLKVTARSGNTKTGPIPVTSRGQWSCPTSCPFMGSGCYGENHRIGGGSTLFQVAEEAERTWTTESLAVAMSQSDRPRKGQVRQRMIVRDREVGDVLDEDGEVDHEYLQMVTDAAHMVGRRPFGYTHVPGLTADDVPDGYVMNASCETPEQVADAHRRGLPAVIVGDHDGLALADPEHRYAACPAESRDITCAECGLCAQPGRMKFPHRAAVIVFEPHGAQRRKARAAVEAALIR